MAKTQQRLLFVAKFYGNINWDYLNFLVATGCLPAIKHRWQKKNKWTQWTTRLTVLGSVLLFMWDSTTAQPCRVSTQHLWDLMWSDELWGGVIHKARSLLLSAFNSTVVEQRHLCGTLCVERKGKCDVTGTFGISVQQPFHLVSKSVFLVRQNPTSPDASPNRLRQRRNSTEERVSMD